jgi:hypothetical protein
MAKERVWGNYVLSKRCGRNDEIQINKSYIYKYTIN